MQRSGESAHHSSEPVVYQRLAQSSDSSPLVSKSGSDSSEENFAELTEMNDSKYSKVIFSEISESYASDADIECRFYIGNSVVVDNEDTIALFRVGWTDAQQAITAKRIADTVIVNEFGERLLTFMASQLPKDGNEFYQFCYLTKDDNMCGASTPFRFSRCDEHDLIEAINNSDEDGFVVVRSQQALLQERLEQMANANGVLEYSKRALEQQISSANAELHELRNKKVEYEDKLKITTMEVKRYKENFNNEEEKNRKLTEQIEKLEQDLAEMKKIRMDQDMHLENSQIQMMEMSRKLNSAELRDSSIVQQLHIRDDENALLTKRAADQQMIIDDLKCKMSFIDSELELSRASIAKIMSERRDLDAENKMLRNEMEDIKAKCDTLEANKKLMMHEIYDLERTKLKSSDELKCMVESMEGLKKQLNQTEDKQYVSSTEWKVKEEDMQKQLDCMKSRLSKAAEEYQKVYKQNAKLEAKIERIKSKVKKYFDTKSSSKLNTNNASPLELQQMISDAETEVKTIIENDLTDMTASVNTKANKDNMDSIKLISLPCTICSEMVVCSDRDLKPMTTHLETKHSQRLCPICSMLFDLTIPGSDNYFQMHVENHFDVPNYPQTTTSNCNAF